MIKKQTYLLDKFVIWLFPLIAFQFYQFNQFDKNVVILSAVSLIGLSLFYSRKEIFGVYYENKTLRVFQFFFIWIILCSLICPYLFWGQNIFLNFRISIEFLRYVFFFLLLKHKFNEEKLIQLVDVFFVLFFVLKIVGLIYAPKVIFGFGDNIEINNNRGIYRVDIEGGEFAVLAFFMHLNFYFKKRQKKDFLFLVLAYACILLSMVRQLMFLTSIIGVLFIVSQIRYKMIALLILSLFFWGINLLLDSDLPVVKDIVLETKTQIDDNNKGDIYIRILEAKYFLFDFNKSIPQIIFGNGSPHAYSDYGKKIIKLGEKESYFANDIGYILIYITYGIVGVFLFLYLFYKLLKIPSNNSLSWCKLYLIYLLFANIASQAIMTSGITVSIVAYILIKNNSFNSLLKTNKI